MSLERKRWAQRAQELRFQQLTNIRKQAEGWRAGLAGMTTLLGAVLVVKGRDTLDGLTGWAKTTVAVLLAIAGLALVVATIQAVRATSGSPGSLIVLTGEELEAWTGREVRAVAQRIRWAAALTVLALSLLLGAIGLTWFGPVDKPAKTRFEVVGPFGRICGELVGSADGELIVKETELRRVRLTLVTSINPVESCG